MCVLSGGAVGRVGRGRGRWVERRGCMGLACRLGGGCGRSRGCWPPRGGGRLRAGGGLRTAAGPQHPSDPPHPSDPRPHPGKRRDAEDAHTYVRQKDEQQAQSREEKGKSKNLYPHLTRATDTNNNEIGRAACRGRVEISVVGGSLKKKKHNKKRHVAKRTS